jgi:hypothetical protein
LFDFCAVCKLQLTVAKDIIAKDGFGSLYKGLSAGLLRQVTYTTARLGIFSQITDMAKKANDGKNLPLWQKAACGLTAGGLGALVGTPADLTLIRMQVRLGQRSSNSSGAAPCGKAAACAACTALGHVVA